MSQKRKNILLAVALAGLAVFFFVAFVFEMAAR